MLIAVGGLAPASVVMGRLEVARFVRHAKEAGASGASVDLGVIFILPLFLGLASLVAGLISLLLDIRPSHHE